MLLPASALQQIGTHGTLAAKPGHVACKKDIPYLKRRAQQIRKFCYSQAWETIYGELKQGFGFDIFEFRASRYLSQFEAYCCSHTKRKCGLIIARKEERHGLDLNKSNLGKNRVEKNEP